MPSVYDLMYVTANVVSMIFYIMLGAHYVKFSTGPSTRRRDETVKRRLYERSGVSEYWFVEPDGDVMRVYRREGETFGGASELSREAGDVLTTPLLPGLDMPLSRIFRT